MARRPSPAERQAAREVRSVKRRSAHERRHSVRVAQRHHLEARQEQLAGQVQVTLPGRRREPESVIAHLGPTNSGKTHDSLRELVQRGRGVFASPLRMLAQEAHARLSALAGAQNVGLVTGEERVNEHAPIIAATAEMAPRSGELLVLDECHWAAERERGHAWTRLLAAGEYRHIRPLGAADALPLLRSAFGPALELRAHQRLSPLDWTGAVHISELTPGTVVVAFSRRAVLGLTDRLRQRYGADRVVCLYGAMPLAARRHVIDRVLAGEADIVVATDVLGHGVNLPARTVLFAQSSKYDGRRIRDLDAWEAAQIAGRAGRFGLQTEGLVGVLQGAEFFDPDPAVIHSALTPTVRFQDGLWGYRQVTHGMLRPELSDLGECESSELEFALAAWERAAHVQLDGHPWFAAQSTFSLRARLRVASHALGRRGLDTLSCAEAFQLCSSPLDPDEDADREILQALALELAGAHGALPRVLPNHKAVAHMRLAEAERAARMAAAVRWAANTFAPLAEFAGRAAATEQAAAARVIEKLAGVSTGIGSCGSCANACAPWFELCERCYAEQT